MKSDTTPTQKIKPENLVLIGGGIMLVSLCVTIALTHPSLDISRTWSFIIGFTLLLTGTGVMKYGCV